MSELSLFLRENKVKRENRFFAATKSLTDTDGNPLMWEIRPISTREDETVRDECMVYDSATGRFRLDVNRYMAKITALAVVEPNLYNAALQTSYDVNTPEELIREMLDEPSEYQAFVKQVRAVGLLDKVFSERTEEAKN
ncbi:MAG: hypothetical protein FWG83_06500 [Oscillospiraceae bacterium]|nr:hypothetical protein [Oscillospiraceae bacterium]